MSCMGTVGGKRSLTAPIPDVVHIAVCLLCSNAPELQISTQNLRGCGQFCGEQLLSPIGPSFRLVCLGLVEDKYSSEKGDESTSSYDAKETGALPYSVLIN